MNGVTRLAVAEATVKKGRPTGGEIFKEIETAATRTPPKQNGKSTK